ncbi:hypothetical protein EV183_005594 [Coemansia sp. RSA 2336]|nr:hypothetical protein EV183_005594 [Coemansia sp. RSA 2336]
MAIVTKKKGALTTFIIAALFYTRNRIQFSKTLAQQLFRDNSQPTSTYQSSDQLPLTAPEGNILVYTHIGCTFDPHVCGFLSGCKQAYKVCDQSMPQKEACNVTLTGSYARSSLGDKNYDFVTHMCRNLDEFGSYDVFVKVDDDLLYDPSQLDALRRVGMNDTRALAGFLNYRQDDQVVWPAGPIYAYSKQTLLALCEDQRARRGLRGMYEDVHFGMALSRIRNGPRVRYFNLDNVIDVAHLQYKSSRAFVQFLQYSSCHTQ